MRKEQNVIRTIILIFSLMMAIQSQGQEKPIEGVYSNLMPKQEHYRYFEFFGNGKFEYHDGGCLGKGFYGKGSFIFKGSEIVLDYHKIPSKKIGSRNMEFWEISNDSIEIKVLVHNENGTPIKGTNVYFMNDEDGNGYEGGIVDENGRIELKTPKDHSLLKINVSNIGYFPHYIHLSRQYSYLIDILLVKDEGKGIPIINQKDTLEIIEFTNEYFKIKTKEGNIETWSKKK